MSCDDCEEDEINRFAFYLFNLAEEECPELMLQYIDNNDNDIDDAVAQFITNLYKEMENGYCYQVDLSNQFNDLDNEQKEYLKNMMKDYINALCVFLEKKTKKDKANEKMIKHKMDGIECDRVKMILNQMLW